jgi:hypothetical protein
LSGLLKDHAVAASHHDATLNNAASSYTTSVDSTGRVASSPDNDGTDRHYRMAWVRKQEEKVYARNQCQRLSSLPARSNPNTVQLGFGARMAM